MEQARLHPTHTTSRLRRIWTTGDGKDFHPSMINSDMIGRYAFKARKEAIPFGHGPEGQNLSNVYVILNLIGLLHELITPTNESAAVSMIFTLKSIIVCN